MSFTLHHASVGLVSDALNTLLSVVDKSEHNPSIASASIIGDMKPFSFQVHTATDIAQKMVARLTGTEPGSYEDNLADFSAMKTRINEVLAILAAANKATVDAKADEDVAFPMGGSGKEAKVKGWMYVTGFAVPNIFFHVVTAYDIARKEGVPLGKLDYLTPFALKYLEGQM